MAQLRQDHAQITAHGAEVVVVGPEDGPTFAAYWAREAMPFVGLADPDHRVAAAFGQRVSLLRLGRLPTLVIVDRQGRLRYRHDGVGMHDIPATATVLAVLRALAAESAEVSDPADGAALVGDAAPPVQAAPAGPDAEAPPERPAPGEAPIDDRPHRAAGRGATLTPSEAGTR